MSACTEQKHHQRALNRTQAAGKSGDGIKFREPSIHRQDLDVKISVWCSVVQDEPKEANESRKTNLARQTEAHGEQTMDRRMKSKLASANQETEVKGQIKISTQQ